MTKLVSIKGLVSVANVILYTALVLIFLILGLQKWNIAAITGYKIGYVLIGFATVIFIIYHLVRIHELKKTSFQLLRKHIIFMQVFYIGQYLIFAISLFFLILTNTKVLNPTQICIFWYVWFPFVFVGTIVFSVLESIVRVEERIFIVKKNWQDSELWEKEQQETSDKVTLEKNNLSKKSQNPFFDDDKNSN
ncbi:hypothetical protein [Spiroplasma sp. SV19]|uniref:hypothetical protein n=1 Tax=Spiroplasma sp. SV19 TaxID=2570468 RepID=UPI0024B7D2AE|nr:hypothetical protein [Spiroplasma sp. SV19]WHQ37430.1 hypothetical protein E7Y35_06220 [Spiroplasma sp. SV19]